jgi:transcriptional regulator with XRE-family HTH domain
MQTVKDILTDFESRAAAIGWDKKALLERCGLPFSTWYRWETGRTSPQYRVLIKIDETIAAAEKRAQ